LVKRTKKIIVLSGLALLLVTAFLCGSALYIYHNPALAKTFIEDSVSRSTGASLSIGHLAYSLSPMSIRARDIRLAPGETLRGFSIEIPRIKADMSVSGPFGEKSLIIRTINVKGFSCDLSHDMILPKMDRKPETPSFMGSMIKRLIAFFLFRDIQFQALEVTEGAAVLRMDDKLVRASAIEAHLNDKHLIEISMSVHALWPLEKMRFTARNIRMTTDRALSLVDREIACRLTAAGTSFQSPDASFENMEMATRCVYDRNQRAFTLEPLSLHMKGISLKGTSTGVDTAKVNARLIYRQSHEDVTFEPLDIRLEGIKLAGLSENGAILPSLSIHAAGVLEPFKKIVTCRDFRMALGRVLKLRGEADLDMGTDVRMRVMLNDGRVFPQKLRGLLPPELTRKMALITFKGPVDFEGGFSGRRKHEAWDWQFALESRLRDNAISFAAGGMLARGTLSGDIRAKGDLKRLDISANIRGTDGVFTGKGLDLKPLTASIAVSGTYPRLAIKDVAVKVPRTIIRAGQREIPIEDVQVSIPRGTLNALESSLRIPRMEIRSSLFKDLGITADISREKMVMTLEGKETNLLGAAGRLGYLPEGWKVSGVDSIVVRGSSPKGRRWSFSSRLILKELSFESPDSAYAGEKISVTAESEGALDIKAGSLALGTRLSIPEGEVLFDRFYLDLKRNRLDLSCDADLDLIGKGVKLRGLGLRLKDLAALDARGEMSFEGPHPGIRLSLKIPSTDLRPILEQFVKEPFQTEIPALVGLKANGVISADLSISEDKGLLTAKGGCRWEKGEISYGEDAISLKGIDLKLPLWYRSGASRETVDALKGELVIKSASLPLLPAQSFRMRMAARPNRFSVMSGTPIKSPGGDILLGPVEARNIFGTKPLILTSLSMKGLRIQPILSRFWARPVNGIVNGTLAPVRIEGSTLSTRGNIVVHAFDGKVVLSNLGASGLLTPATVFRASAGINDLHLAKMTEDTPFGKVEGVLQGHIRDIEIAYGQPQRFDLLLETVKTKGVSQRISVKAVDNIARIGGGQSPFIGLAGGFATLFKEFSYRKIGVRASLENDVFKINGTIKEGGKEYLVKRGGFSGVNIVNQNPDNRASFKDMVKRMKRVTAGRGGPVVK
jgi:hypothetical protein